MASNKTTTRSPGVHRRATRAQQRAAAAAHPEGAPRDSAATRSPAGPAARDDVAGYVVNSNESTMFSAFQTAFSNAIKQIGEGLASTARKG
jgi:hypothetical protein